MIHVAYRLWGGDGFFAKMCGTSMLSMFENTKEKITVHVMHNERLTLDNRDKFCYIAGQYNQQIDFRNVEEIAGDILKKFEEVHPNKSGINAAWYPLIVHEVFPELDKLIFLGADTVFNLDIGELWAYDLEKGKNAFAAVQEFLNKTPAHWLKLVNANLGEYEDYFNADVMLLEPKFFRENFDDILNACKFIYDNKLPNAEQDALNYLYPKNYLKLPVKFNVMVRNMRLISEFHIDKAIYHFAVTKPSLDTNDVYNKLYFEYFLKTPWATVDMFGNIHDFLDKSFRKFNNNAKNSLLHMNNLLSTRRRAFAVSKNLLKSAKQIFEIKDDELVITLPTKFETLIKKLNSVKGEIVLYALTNNYPQLRNILLRRKFIEGTDFVNALSFLSEQQGIKFNFDTRAIVQEM